MGTELVLLAVFLTQIISRRQKMPTRKLYNRFHVGKNEICVGNFQKDIFSKYSIKYVGNRLPPFKNLSNHTNRFLKG